MKKVILFIIVIFIISGCYISRPLEQTVVIMIYDNSDVDIHAEGNNKYIYNYSSGEYKDAFMRSFTDELKNCNLILTDNPDKADYSISFDKIYASETSKQETVDDQQSEYHGMTYVLSSCEVSAEYKLYQGNIEKEILIDEFNTSAEKEEKVTNNRNVSDYIAGSNKDNSEYRQKELYSDVFISLSEKCGRRVTAAISKRIYKHLKKGK